jgi:hypothetical protein
MLRFRFALLSVVIWLCYCYFVTSLNTSVWGCWRAWAVQTVCHPQARFAPNPKFASFFHPILVEEMSEKLLPTLLQHTYREGCGPSSMFIHRCLVSNDRAGLKERVAPGPDGVHRGRFREVLSGISRCTEYPMVIHPSPHQMLA